MPRRGISMIRDRRVQAELHQLSGQTGQSAAPHSHSEYIPRTDATAIPTPNKIPIADGNGTLDAWFSGYKDPLITSHLRIKSPTSNNYFEFTYNDELNTLDISFVGT